MVVRGLTDRHWSPRTGEKRASRRPRHRSEIFTCVPALYTVQLARLCFSYTVTIECLRDRRTLLEFIIKAKAPSHPRFSLSHPGPRRP